MISICSVTEGTKLVRLSQLMPFNHFRTKLCSVAIENHHKAVMEKHDDNDDETRCHNDDNEDGDDGVLIGDEGDVRGKLEV